MTTRATRPREDGFVLIGVVIFVLALTIIGLSLFSLSSYEAQFLQRSLDGERAFQSALGGIERARFVLCATSRLDAVGEYLPDSNDVIAATVAQAQSGSWVTSGGMGWAADDTVYLWVTARVNGQRRMVEGRFTPQGGPNYYGQLLTTSGGIGVDAWASADANFPAEPTIDFSGPVWQGTIASAADTLWILRLHTWFDRLLLTGDVEVPDLASYFTLHDPALALPVGYSRDPEPADLNRYYFNADPAAPTYYRVPAGFAADACLDDMCDGAIITVYGQGCVVWELPAGVRFRNPPFIRADHGSFASDRCLVIVAGPDPTSPTGTGIFFEGGVQSDIPLVLVSNGRVAIQHINNPGYTAGAGFSTYAPDLAVYAQSVLLRGPRSRTVDNLSMDLRHPAAGSLDLIWVPHLAGHAALPNLSRRLALQPGTWRASTP